MIRCSKCKRLYTSYTCDCSPGTTIRSDQVVDVEEHSGFSDGIYVDHRTADQRDQQAARNALGSDRTWDTGGEG